MCTDWSDRVWRELEQFQEELGDGLAKEMSPLWAQRSLLLILQKPDEETGSAWLAKREGYCCLLGPEEVVSQHEAFDSSVSGKGSNYPTVPPSQP